MGTLSDEYRLQLQEMHQPDEDGRTWGATAVRRVYEIVEKIEQARGDTLMATPRCTILDYGSADGKFLKQVSRRGLLEHYPEIQCYDPGIPEYWDEPDPAWFVMCIDVLEHIEPEYLDKVLEHIRSKCTHRFLFHIAMSPARQILPDGRNAHLIVEDEQWWRERLEWYTEHRNENEDGS
jgi:hypothetical protein